MHCINSDNGSRRGKEGRGSEGREVRGGERYRKPLRRKEP